MFFTLQANLLFQGNRGSSWWPLDLQNSLLALCFSCIGVGTGMPPDFKTSAIQIHPGLLSLCGPQIWVLFYTLLFSSMKHEPSEKCTSMTVLIELEKFVQLKITTVRFDDQVASYLIMTMTCVYAINDYKHACMWCWFKIKFNYL